MNASLQITNQYGFCHNWTLLVKFRGKKLRRFFLGQDVKFCTRVLAMRPGDVVQQSGVRDLRTEENQQKLAKWIVEKLGMNKDNIDQFEDWSLSSQ